MSLLDKNGESVGGQAGRWRPHKIAHVNLILGLAYSHRRDRVSEVNTFTKLLMALLILKPGKWLYVASYF